CIEARWIDADRTTSVASVSQLKDLIAAWDGSPPAPTRLLAAQNEARAAAKERVEQMQARAEAEVEAGLRRQLNAVRRRLLRELARTLRCLGGGDLNVLFEAQVQHERSNDRRYH